MAAAPPTQTLFAQDAVKQLTSADFTVNKQSRIKLVYEDCYLILFYGNNQESDDLLQVWQSAAAQVAGPIFASVNLFTEKAVATAFTQIRSESDNPLNWAGLRGIPFILVYRQGWPVGFYNGPRETETIIDYSLELACSASYKETIQNASGSQPDQNIGIEPTFDNPLYTQSTNYNGDTGRGYVPGVKTIEKPIPPELGPGQQIQVPPTQQGPEVIIEPVPKSNIVQP